MFAKTSFSLILLITASTLSAQSSPAASYGVGSHNENVQQDQRMARAALQVAGLVDAGRAAEVWDGASSVAKTSITKDAFVKQIFADRLALGPLIARQPINVSYRSSDGKHIPFGLYANVAFASHFSNTKQVVRELISFHLDDDHIWRVSGYTVR